MVRATPLQTTSQLGSNVVVLSDSSLLSGDTFSTGSFPVPGLGFDFAHLAALNGNFRASAMISAGTPQHVTQFVPFAFPFFSSPPQVIVVQQPPVVIVQQPAVSDEAPEEPRKPARRSRRVEPREEAEPAPPPEPPREVGEFILVRRDGSVVLAVAFSTEGERLTYITREGVRRSLPLAELDIETTRQMNEARGTTLRLPA